MSTKTTTIRKLSDSYDAAKRILLGGKVDPSLSADQVAEYVERHDEAARKGDDDERERWFETLLDKRRANETWDVVDCGGDLMHELADGTTVALLQDIRDELHVIRVALEKRPR